MNSLASIRKLLGELVESTASPIYSTCDNIAMYLEVNPMQRDLTIGGLRAALGESPANDQVLIQAAFTLTVPPLEALEVRYRLYDELLSDVLEEVTHVKYMQAISEEQLIDDDGNTIALEELNRRLYPYFINKFQTTTIAGSSSDETSDTLSNFQEVTMLRSMMESE